MRGQACRHKCGGPKAARNQALLSRQIYELRVMETKPDKAVSIIECDMNVSGRGRRGVGALLAGALLAGALGRCHVAPGVAGERAADASRPPRRPLTCNQWQGCCRS